MMKNLWKPREKASYKVPVAEAAYKFHQSAAEPEALHYFRRP